MTPNLTIIITTFNSQHIIGNCLSKLNLSKYPVIVVDNASSDQTVELISQNFPTVKIIKNNQNLGYGRANNIALRQTETEFALILNPDAMIFESEIEKVLQAMKENQQISLATPLILEKYPLNQEELNQKLEVIKRDLTTIKDNFRSLIDNSIYEVRFAIGCAMFLKMNIFKRLGFFDENIFLYYEDDEICLKSNLAGFKNAVFTNIFAFHLGGKSSGNVKNFRSIFKKNWHLKGWSKLYWKGVSKGKFKAKKSAARLIFSYFVRTAFALLKFDKNAIAENFGACCGSFAYLIGMSAFDQNSNPRG